MTEDLPLPEWFPDWLPADKKKSLKWKIENDKLAEQDPLLEKLLSDQKMRPVWQALIDLSTDFENDIAHSNKLANLLNFIIQHPSLQGDPTAPVNIISDRLQKLAFNKIKQSLDKAITELKNLTVSRDTEAGIQVLQSAIKRTHYLALIQKDQEVIASIARAQLALQHLQAEFGITDILETLSFAAKVAMLAPESKRPKKLQTRNAKRNLFIADLKQLMLDHFGDPFNSLVTTITNTVLIHPDGAITLREVTSLEI